MLRHVRGSGARRRRVYCRRQLWPRIIKRRRPFTSNALPFRRSCHTHTHRTRRPIARDLAPLFDIRDPVARVHSTMNGLAINGNGLAATVSTRANPVEEGRRGRG